MRETLPDLPVEGACTRRPGATDTKCRCSKECFDLASRASKMRHYRKDYRGISGRVPAVECAAHVRAVLDGRPGATLIDFAAASEVSEKTLRNLMAGKTSEHLYRTTADKILATSPADLKVVKDRRLVSGEQCQRWVEEMQERGWSVERIATEAGLSVSTIMPENLGTVYVDTARRIKRARVALSGVNPTPLVSTKVCKARRQIEGLMTSGWSGDAIARTGGVSRATLTRLSRESTATGESLERIEHAYERLRYRVGPSQITMKRARQMGYAPWSAWRRGDMERPDATPDLALVDDPAWRAAIRKRYGL